MKQILFIAGLCALAGNAISQGHFLAPILTNPAAYNYVLANSASLSTGGSLPSTLSATNSPVVAAQWHYAGQGVTSTSTDWIYSLVNTDKKETIACGYSAGTGGGATIQKIDHFGAHVWCKVINTATTTITEYDCSSTSSPTPTTISALAKDDLWAVTKAANGNYIAVGRGGHVISGVPTYGIMIVEVDESGTYQNGTPIVIIPPSSPTGSDGTISSGVTGGFGFTVATDPVTNSINNIVVGGCAFGSSFGGGGLWTFNYNPITSHWSVGSSYYAGNNYGGSSGSCVNKVITRGTGYPFEIYATGAISKSGDNATTSSTNADGSSVTVTTFAKDIWILKGNSSLTTATTINERYNKDNVTTDAWGIAFDDLNYVGPATYQYAETGPLSARAMDPSNGNAIKWYDPFAMTTVTSPATVYLNADHNKNMAGFDMVFADGGTDLALVAMVNIIGNNGKGVGGYTGGGYVKDYSSPHYLTSAAPPNYGEYTDGDAFLIKVKISLMGMGISGAHTYYSLDGAKNVGHFSGTDFFLQMKLDKQGNYIIAGSTADQYSTFGEGGDFNLSPDADIVGGAERALVVCADNTFYPQTMDLWRRSYAAADARAGTDDEDCMCVFGMDLTDDGGFIIGGNNDLNGDDWSVTKFAPYYQTMMLQGLGGSYNTFGGSQPPVEYHITSGMGTVTWSSDMNIATKVVVDGGATLNITGTSTTPVNIHFAASDQLWDYATAPDNGSIDGGTLGSGIFVRPGGRVNINYANLSGINCTTQHNVWDGIVVEGTYAAYSLPAYQGVLNMNNSTVRDARIGLYVGDDYRAYYQGSPVYYGGVSSGRNYSSRYDGTCNMGGGKISVTYTNFTDCRYGGNLMNYFYYSNNSHFSNCHFNSTSAGMGDICFYTDGDGRLLPANTYLSATQWRFLNVDNSTFDCDPSFICAERPAGIVFRSCGVNINTNNTFHNLSYGIHGSAPCWSYGISIQNNTFNNNGYGVAVAGLANVLTIKNNQFNIPGYSNPLPLDMSYFYPYPTGIELAGCSGYNVSQNTFDMCTGCYTNLNTGIYVNNGNTQDEKINLNTFDHITYATYAAGNNGSTSSITGLQFLCNTYNNSIIDIDRSSYLRYGGGLSPGTLRTYQGDCGSTTSPAGNQFNNGCVTTTSHLHVEDGSVAQMVHYNANAFSSVFDPGACYYSTKYSDGACSPSAPDVSSACPLPCYGCEISVYLQQLTALDEAIAQNNDQDVAASLQTQHSLLLSDIARQYTATEDYSSAAALFAGYNMYRDALPFYIAAGDYQDAQSMVNNLPTNTSEEQLYAAGAQKAVSLFGNGQSWFNLDQNSRASLAQVDQYDQASGYMAGAVMSLLGMGPVTLPIPVLDSATVDTILWSDSSQQRLSNGAQPIAAQGKNNTALFSIHPNPSSGSFVLNASGSGKFVIYTMLGQLLQEYTVTVGNSEFLLPTNLAAGMYIGRFKPDDGGKTSEIRLVYQP